MVTRGDDPGRKARMLSPEAALWRRSCVTDAATSEAERYLDLAAFADGRLDPDDRERVAEWLAGDSEAAGDVAAARALAMLDGRLPSAPEALVARAGSLVGGAPQQAAVIPFPTRARGPRLRRIAGWGGFAAAMAVASWLGFILGVDASLSYTQIGQAREDGFLREMFDPSTGFPRDLTGGAQT
jgi:anti-sigma factor RsiW